MLDFALVFIAFLLIAVGAIGFFTNDERNYMPAAICAGFGICILIAFTWVYLN